MDDNTLLDDSIAQLYTLYSIPQGQCNGNISLIEQVSTLNDQSNDCTTGDKYVEKYDVANYVDVTTIDDTNSLNNLL